MTIALAVAALVYYPILILIERRPWLPDAVAVAAMVVGGALFCCLLALPAAYLRALRRSAVWAPESIADGAMREAASMTPPARRSARCRRSRRRPDVTGPGRTSWPPAVGRVRRR